MLVDIRDPQLVGLVAMKLPLDAVAGGGHAMDVPVPWSPRDALNAGAAHQQLNGLMTDRDALSEREVCVDPPSAVRAPGQGMHLPDQVSEPGVANRAR